MAWSTAASDHVLVDLGDDRVERHRRMIREPRRSEQPRLLGRVIDEQDGPLRARASERHRFGDLENRHRATAVVVSAVVARAMARAAVVATVVVVATVTKAAEDNFDLIDIGIF